MISQSKKKRLHIMEQISERSRQKQKQSSKRQSSAERRKKIEANFNDFVHTMHNFPFSHSKSKFSNQSVKFNTGSMFYKEQSESQSNDNSVLKNQIQKNQLTDQKMKIKNIQESPNKIQVIQQLNYSKFSQDRNIKKEQNKKAEKNVYNLQLSSKNQKEIIENSPNSSSHQKEQEIIYNLSGNSCLSGSRNKSTHTQQLSAIKQEPFLEKQLAQTSKFNTFQINNQKKQEDEGEQIKIPLNLITSQNREDAVSNNSSAIFFTSQFHQFINRQKNQSKQSERKDQINEQIHFDQQNETKQNLSQKSNHKRHNTQLEEADQNQQKKLSRNKSGKSIADSNASSLKYSLYESNINAHQMLNYKLTNQLVVDADNFLYPAINIQIFADKILKRQWQNILKSIKQFNKLWNLKQKVQKRKVLEYFDAFLINKELNFQQKKNQIKAENYLKQKQEFLKIYIFGALKKFCFTLPKNKQKKADDFFLNIKSTMVQKCFRNIKIGWYNRKVDQQIQMYYLSKMFYHLKKACKKQQSIDRNKVLHFYSKNMKRKFFKYFLQGIYNTQDQRIKNENAQWHYDYNLMKKCMQGWKQRVSSNQNKFISLAMTTKNAFKETQDHKWMHIRTVDFRQLK